MSDYGTYGFGENTGASVYLPGGIHQNVTLKSIDFEPAKEGAEKALRFKFEKEGMNFIHTEFKITKEGIERAAKLFQKSAKEVGADEFKKQGERLKHLLVAFYPETKIQLTGDGWEDFCKKYLELAGDLFKGEQFRLKVIYNNKGYTTFPNRAISPFIQNMKQPNALVINPKYDKVVPPQPKDTTEEGDEGDMYPATTDDAPTGEQALQF